MEKTEKNRTQRWSWESHMSC